MKRKLALLVLVILSVTVLLVACTQPDPTAATPRWDNETHVFHISLADFGKSDGDYKKEQAMTSELLYTTKDEVQPKAVSGTYTMTITPNAGSGTCVVTTVQVLYAQYNREDVTAEYSKKLSEEDLNKLLVKVEQHADEAEQKDLVADENSVILRSETTTLVEFKIPSQAPIRSETKVDGFYIGKANCNVTEYEVKTQYDFETNEKKPTAKVTIDGHEETYTLPSKTSTVDVIDSNQLLLYVRSLDKSKTSLQDSKSARVFDGFSGETHTASFAFYNYESKLILTDGDESINVTLNSISVSVDGIAFMLQDNLPTVKLQVDDDSEENLDWYVTSSGGVPKYTTVHFRVGYLSYEIEYSNEANSTDWGKIWQALAPVTEPEEDVEDETPAE